MSGYENKWKVVFVIDFVSDLIFDNYHENILGYNTDAKYEQLLITCSHLTDTLTYSEREHTHRSI